MRTCRYHHAAGRKIVLSQPMSGTALLLRRAGVLGFRPFGRAVRSGAVSVAASASGCFVPHGYHPDEAFAAKQDERQLPGVLPRSILSGRLAAMGRPMRFGYPHPAGKGHV